MVAEEEGSASAEDLVYRQSLLKQTIRQGDSEKEAVSFLILVDENTNTAFLPQMLQILADNQVAATFFVSGKFAEKNPDLLKGILARGNKLGNYSYAVSYTHLDVYKRQPLAQRWDYLGPCKSKESKYKWCFRMIFRCICNFFPAPKPSKNRSK